MALPTPFICTVNEKLITKLISRKVRTFRWDLPIYLDTRSLHPGRDLHRGGLGRLGGHHLHVVGGVRMPGYVAYPHMRLPPLEAPPPPPVAAPQVLHEGGQLEVLVVPLCAQRGGEGH